MKALVDSQGCEINGAEASLGIRSLLWRFTDRTL